MGLTADSTVKMVSKTIVDDCKSNSKVRKKYRKETKKEAWMAKYMETASNEINMRQQRYGHSWIKTKVLV
jgi:hypothetical protein